jgi:serine/threonine protein kinase
MLPDGTGEVVYRVIDHIADGGMASIYLVDVKDRSKGPYVMKVNRAHDHVPALYREAWWQHQRFRGIVPCSWPDHTVILGKTYAIYVMPFFREGTLLNRLLARSYSDMDAVEWIYGISSTLDEMKVVHRDLKPENVMLIDNKPLVSDFGLAISGDQKARTEWGEHVNNGGTITYMSPEQHLDNLRQEIDCRSDIYTLNLMLYELLTGNLPYAHNCQIHEIIEIKLYNKMQMQNHYCQAVNDLLKKGLVASRAKRFQTHAEFKAALINAHTELKRFQTPA